jgi:two-component system sensor histidine kinase UhpB
LESRYAARPEKMKTDDAVPATPGCSAREHLLQSIWDHSLDAILLTAPDGRIFAANPAACNLFDRTEEDICRVGRNGLLDLSDPGLAGALAEREAQGYARRELAMLRADGSRFYGEVTSTVFTDSDGQLKTSMIIRDVTAHRQADERTRTLTLFPLHNPGPVLQVNPKGKVLFANPVAETLGLRVGILLGEVIPMLAHFDLAPHIRDGVRFELEVAVGGQFFSFTIHGLPTEEAALLYGINITDRKYAEEALRQSEAQFRAALDFLAIPIGISDLAGNNKYMNPAFTRQFGYTIEDIPTLAHWVQRAYPDETYRQQIMAQGDADLAATLQEQRATVPRLIQIVAKDGRRRDAECTMRMVGPHFIVAFNDVTERKRAEEALRQSEQKFRAIFELAPVGIALLNAEQQITDCNSALEQITQLTKDELLAGKSQQRTYLRADGSVLPLAEFPIARVARERQVIRDVELGIVREDGRKTWVLINAAPLDTSAAHVLIIAQDITARKAVETALLENEQRLRVALALPDIAVFNQDLDLRYTWMFQPQLGYTTEQVVGKTDFELLPREAAELITRVKRAALTGGGVVRREVPVAWQGGLKTYDLMVEPLRNAAGAVVGITGSSLDITDRQRADEALRLSEARLQLVLEATLDGVWDWDLRTSMAYLSPRYYEMTGYQPGEVTPDLEFYKRLVHPEDFPAVWQAVEANLQGRAPHIVVEYRMVRKDGSLLWVLERGHVVERAADGAPRRTVGTITDITARKRAEADLAASRQALRALTASLQGAREEERLRIARTVHDELGHAFTDLKLDLAWLDRRLAERKLTRRSALRRKLALMVRQVEEGLGAARQIATELRPAVLDALGFVAALEWAVQKFSERTHITCTVELPSAPLTLDAKRSTALFRAFQELLANIAQHAQATAVRVRVTSAGNEVTLEVADNGRGITAQEREAPDALGLLGIRERALELGGTAEFCDVPGSGTCVCIRIPRMVS